VVGNRIDVLEEFRKQLEGADVDLLREMVKVYAEQLMGADADALCGADYGERSPERINRRSASWDADGRPLGCGCRPSPIKQHPALVTSAALSSASQPACSRLAIKSWP